MTPKTVQRAMGSAATFIALSLAPSAGLADTASDKAAAEALFEHGKRLVSEGKFDEACPKFETSQQLDAGIGTLLYLADCYQQAGRYASAWATYKEAAAAARAAGQADREDLARELAKEIEPKLSRLTISVDAANALPGFEVRRDGQVVSQALWGSPLPIDAGSSRIEARAPGKKPFVIEVSVAIAGTAEVTVPSLEDDPNAVAAPAPAPVAAAPAPATAPLSQAPAEPARDQGRAGSGQRIAGWVIGTVGLAALGAGGAFALKAISKDGDADDHCDALGCSEEGVDLGDEAKSAADLATIFSIAGIAAVTGGVILVVTAPSGGSDHAARSPGVTVGYRGAW